MDGILTQPQPAGAPTSAQIISALGYTPQRPALFVSGATVSIVNSVVETTFLTGSVPAGVMGTNGCLEATLLVDGACTATAGAIRIRATLGSTLVFDGQTSNVTTGAGRRQGIITLNIYNKNSASSQGTHCQFRYGALSGWLGNDTFALDDGGAGGSENTANALTLTITATLTAAGADFEFVKLWGGVRLINS